MSMAIKSFGIKSLALLFFFQLLHLGAQEIVYFQEPRLVQRLVWIGDPYALHYELLIEKEEDGVYQSLISEITTATSIEVSLSPGQYRYGVIPYDMLGNPAESPEWTAFEVLPALRPEPSNFSPASFALDQDAVLTLSIFGRNLVQGAEIFLRSLDFDEDPIVPMTINILNDGREARALFDAGLLQSGDYEIHIRNPGGLEAGIRGFAVTGQFSGTRTPRRPASPADPFTGGGGPVDFYLGLDWMPIALLYGESNRLFGEKFVLTSAMMRFGGVSSKESFLNFGMEVTLSWYALTSSSGSSNANRPSTVVVYNMIGAQSAAIEYNILMQKRFPDANAALSLRGGVGVTMPLSYSVEESKAPERYAFHANLGYSFFGFIYRNFYLEWGMDFSPTLSANKPSGFVRPWYGVGWMF